jgi:membrane protease YdiL (CAAX protease family)
VSTKVKFFLILIAAFPYYQITTWKYVIATFFIFYLFKKFHPQNFKERLGLNFQSGRILWGIGLFLACAVFIELYIQWYLPVTGVTKESPTILGLWFLQPFFQSLNEEMLARSVFVLWLTQKFKTPNEWTINVLMASAFTALHFATCAWIFKTPMVPMAGVVIFVATILMNLIYFRTNNILFTWAIHFGINFSFFGGNYTSSQNVQLNDAEKFNLIYGSYPVVLSLSLVGFGVLIWERYSKIRQTRQPCNKLAIKA